MAMKLPYQGGEVTFIPYGAPVFSEVTNTAPRQIKADVEFLFDLLSAVALSPKRWNSSGSYSQGQLVANGNGDLYYSKVDYNVALLTDTNSWENINVNLRDIGNAYKTIKTSGSITARCRDKIYCDTSGSGRLNIGQSKFTVTLPSSPYDGDVVVVVDDSDNAQNFPILVETPDSTIMGIDTSVLIDHNSFIVEFHFNGNHWTMAGR